VQFQVLVDRQVKAHTPVIRDRMLHTVAVDLTGAEEVVLRVRNGGDDHGADHAGWGFARFIEAGAHDPLEEPAELRSTREAAMAMLQSMVLCRLGEKETARAWFAKADAWVEESQSDDEHLLQFRAQAAEFLETADALPPEKERSPESEEDDD
jgi:hypothetical protein